MSTVYVVGGQQKPNAFSKEEWNRFQAGLVVRFDLESGASARCVEYVTPPEVCPDEDPSFLFKAATLRGDRLYVCTQTEILVFALPSFERVAYLTHPLFNDVHHVTPGPGGTLVVANTGLDMVLEMTPGGEVLRLWNVLGEDPWRRFSRDVDYRKVLTTKPHLSHPNFVFVRGEDIWTTRFVQRDAICLTRPGARLAIEVAAPHDGCVDGDRVYFTTVDGRVVVGDLATEKTIAVHSLPEMSPHEADLGWCRGIAPLPGGRAAVGFSRLRPTKFRENVGWVRHKLTGGKLLGALPTRIGFYDLGRKTLVREIDVESTGLNAIFSLHVVD